MCHTELLTELAVGFSRDPTAEYSSCSIIDSGYFMDLSREILIVSASQTSSTLLYAHRTLLGVGTP